MLTVLIPTFNEEKNIRQCIEGIKWADEILIADSFSTDKTLEIAGQYPNVRIIQREYHYSTSQKNWAIPQAKNDWILIVDADERVSPELAEEIKEIVKGEFKEDTPVAYWIRRENFYLGKRIKFCGWQNDKVIRLFRKGKAIYEDKFVHGEMIIDGKVGILKNSLKHYTIENISEHLKKIERYSTWKAMEKNKRGRTSGISVIAGKTFFKFFRDYFLRLGFLDGIYGFILCGISAFSEFITYSKLWKMHKDEKISRNTD